LAIEGHEMKSYLEQYGTVVDSIVMMDQVQGWSHGFGFITYEDGCEGTQKAMDVRALKRPWLLICILSTTSMLKSSMHSPRLLELPCRHHPQQQIPILVEMVEECLIAATSIQSFMVCSMPMDEVDGIKSCYHSPFCVN